MVAPTLPAGFGQVIGNLDTLEIPLNSGGYHVPIIDSDGVLQQDNGASYRYLSDLTIGGNIDDLQLAILAYVVDAWWTTCGQRAQTQTFEGMVYFDSEATINQDGSQGGFV